MRKNLLAAKTSAAHHAHSWNECYGDRGRISGDLSACRIFIHERNQRGCGEREFAHATGKFQNSSRRKLVLVLVFVRDVVFGNFASLHFGNVRVGRVLNSVDDSGLVVLSFFRQFANAFRIHIFNAGQSLNIAGLASGAGQTNPLANLGRWR